MMRYRCLWYISAYFTLRYIFQTTKLLNYHLLLLNCCHVALFTLPTFMGGRFNQSIDSVTLPESLRNFTLGDEFDLNLDQAAAPTWMATAGFTSLGFAKKDIGAWHSGKKQL